MSIKLVEKTPTISSQYKVCPIPFNLDTYVGCVYGCKYCFAKSLTEFARRSSTLEADRQFSNLRGIDLNKLKRWIDSTCSEDTNTHKVAFAERIPIKLGSMSDPFPPVERSLKLTYGTLKLLHDVDYPVRIATKNPTILAEYASDFARPNWVVTVTIITPEEDFCKALEPGAPSIHERFKAIQTLAALKIPVYVRVQPVIYPYIMDKAERLVRLVYNSKAKGVIVEGLKIRMPADKTEQAQFKAVSKVLGYDIRAWYKSNGVIAGTDYELKKEDKLKYIRKLRRLCSKYGLKLCVGDNDCREYSCSGECCGTSLLRKHKTLYDSERLLSCVINFGRSKKDHGKTIKELLDMDIVKPGASV